MSFNYSIHYTKLWALACLALVVAFWQPIALGQVADEYWPITNGLSLETPVNQHDVGVTFNQDVTIVEGDQLSGIRGRFVDAEGNASIVRGVQKIQADYLHYDIPNDEINGRGNVKITKTGILINGDTLRYQPDLEVGEINRAEYFLGERAHGAADQLVGQGFVIAHEC